MESEVRGQRSMISDCELRVLYSDSLISKFENKTFEMVSYWLLDSLISD